MVMNFQSIVGKKSSFNYAIDYYKPDIRIFGTETWLKPTIPSSEMFPSQYQVIRKDRTDGFGGVLLACEKVYTWEEIPIDLTCEIVAAKLLILLS